MQSAVMGSTPSSRTAPDRASSPYRATAAAANAPTPIWITTTSGPGSPAASSASSISSKIGGVALDHPAGDELVPLPRGVGDDERAPSGSAAATSAEWATASS